MTVAEDTTNLELSYIRIVFSSVAQPRTLSIWPWNALWDPAKHISFTTGGQSNKSKPQSDLSLINEVYSLMEPKILNDSRWHLDSLKSEWNAPVQNVTWKELLEHPSAANVLERMLNLKPPHSPGEEKDSLKSDLKSSLQNADIKRSVRKWIRCKHDGKDTGLKVRSSGFISNGLLIGWDFGKVT